MAPHDDDLVHFPADDEPVPAPVSAPPWKILVVDDDQEVHDITRLALAGLAVDGRPVALRSRHTAAAARDALAAERDIGVVMLDVVMESDHAGLELARWIRHDLGDPHVRIVLRTGQPGLAPEHKVMSDYDIHDYRDKTELTARRLATTVLGALRSYRDLTAIAELHRRERVLAAACARFVPERLLTLLGRSDAAEAVLGDQVEREMTVLVVDQRGFTDRAEWQTASDTFAALNHLFAAIVPAIDEQGGLVDRYLGDGLIAVFPDSPVHAVRAALAIVARARDLGVGVGIGVHVGPVTLGLVGADGRMQSTVVADTVHLAAHVERLTRRFDVALLVTEAVHARLPRELAGDTRPLGVSRTGKQRPTAVFEVFSAEAPALRADKRATRDAVVTAVRAMGEWRMAEAEQVLAGLTVEYPGDLALTVLREECRRHRHAVS
ncbi:adenylate/guanylate cyclase domain-containing protein [Nannocystis sp. SCPEA4]|uniref:adenylate/guanylate cyclase domain-containing protein n=1 Tax=Nannocystis sp. SCPEA4 TaxID=2996787 RepID=UPI00227227D5|nr:adenylate/guanylate cyclase domain-containing protein [Nannocystis sp. SCPEA4]MCY1056701.1 adenylate/guanylate cyclase domain-containing protein [Nannocystis sp. SCPEA4]